MFVTVERDLYAELQRIEERGKRNARKFSLLGFFGIERADDAEAERND